MTCCMSTANPNVASARYTPERRMAGMATTSPMGTVRSPARSRPRPQGRPAGEAPGGYADQHGHEDEERHGWGNPVPRPVGEELGRQRGGDAESDATEVGERQAGEQAHRAGPEGLDHEQGEKVGVEVQGRGEEEARGGSESAADRPGRRADPQGFLPAAPGQGRLVGTGTPG